MNTRKFLLIATLLGFYPGITPLADSAPDYRAWQHVKSMIIQPDHPIADTFGGIHHVYANPEAMQGLTQGRYPTGAVFVFDLIDYATDDNTIVETDRKRLDVMRYDPQRFASTGGWEFSSYLPQSPYLRVDQDVVSNCFGCHKAQQHADYVFSKYRP